METELVCVQQKKFGSLSCDFYQKDKSFYMTEPQIGTALEYAHPLKAINNIFQRNIERLNPLSDVLNLRTTDQKVYKVRVFTLRGVMEICRYSKQPKANAFMDFVWDVMESLYRGESVIVPTQEVTAPQATNSEELMDLLKRILKEQEDIKYQLASLPDSFSQSANPASIKKIGYRSSPNQSGWRAAIYSKIHEIVKNYPDKQVNKHDILQKIYEKMNRDYGFVEEQERREYRRRHPNTSGPYITRMDMIEDNGTLSSIFESILEDLLNLSIVHYSEISKDTEAVPQKTVTAHKTSEEEIDDLVSKIAEKIGDTSMKHVYTYRKIYAAMNVRWKMVSTLYAKKHGSSPATRKVMILTSKAVNSEFFRVANKMLEE